jgi:hypothetical protein
VPANVDSVLGIIPLKLNGHLYIVTTL